MSKTHRALVISDTHFRSDYIPGFLDTQVKTLIKLVNAKPPDTLIIGGDVFHKRNPKGDELLAFRKFLDSVKCDNIVILRGNHDTVHKDGSSDTTLSLFADKATIVTKPKTIAIGGVFFDFIPHHESESKIISQVKKAKNHVFGHFGFDGCVSNGSYMYESRLKRWHFPKNKYTFLGHIHKAKKYDNVFVIGTQYSNSFGEANEQKYYMELLIKDGEIKPIRKPVNFGIRHVTCSIDELPSKGKSLINSNFFTMLRIKLDRLDEYVERQIHDKVLNKYKVDYLEFSFEDLLPKFTSDYSPDRKLLTLNEEVIGDYIDSRNSIFSKEDLMGALRQIRDED